MQDVRELSSASAQLSELTEIEHSFSERIALALRDLQAQLNELIPLDINDLGWMRQSPKAAYLGPGASVVMELDGPQKMTVPLAAMSSEQIVAIILDTAPKFKASFANKRKGINQRISVMEKILKELEKLPRADQIAANVAHSNLQESDVIEASLSEV